MEQKEDESDWLDASQLLSPLQLGESPRIDFL